MTPRLSRLLLALVTCASLGGGGWSQDGQESDSTVPRVEVGIPRQAAQERIAELLAAPAAEPAEQAAKAELVELYRQLVQRLDAEKGFVERGESFRMAIESAPVEAAQVRAELAEKQQAPAQAPGELGATSEEVQLELTQAQAALATARAQLAEQERRIAEEESRAGGQAEAEAQARDALAEVEALLAEAPQLGADATERQRVERALLEARQRARTAELGMLQQEALSRPMRVDLLQARRDLAALSIAREEERAGVLEKRLADLRREEAERAREEAERLRREALDKHPLIREAADEIAEVTHETERLLPKIAAIRERRKVVEARSKTVASDLEQTKRSVELGITGALGAVLLEQRRNLPDARSFRRAAASRAGDVADARLRLFRLERQLEEPTGDTAVDALLTPEVVVTLSERDRADLREELRGLIDKRRENLLTLQGALRDYLTAIRELETQERTLLEQGEELASILDERLFWIADAQPLSKATFARLRADLGWLASPASWEECLDLLAADLGPALGGYVLVLLFAGALLSFRRRSRARLGVLATRVGKVHSDAVLLSLQALLLQVLNTLPVPTAGMWVGWRLMAAAGSTDAAKAVGAGLIAASTLYLALQLVRNLCRPDGLARAHFRWTEHTCQVVRRNLWWYVWVALPLTFVIGTTQAQADRLIRYGLGRLAFIALMLAAAVLAYFVLHPRRGLFVGRSVERSSTWMRRSRPLWLPLGVLLTLTLACLAAAGYYYAALQLEYRLNQTLLILVVAVLLHAFFLRWLLVSQRRLALKVALERRAAAAKKSGAVEDEVQLAEEAIENLEDINVVEIQGQAQDMLRISLGLLSAVALWFAWVDVLPALGFLNEIELWDHEVVVDGVSELHPITLANLGLALAAILVTIAAAQNMPGFLEIALLQRLRLEAGVRYATRTLLLYAIVTVGVVLAFNAIGVGWSSVQWLLAALTVGLGFGLQEIFANFVSGLIILLERPIRVGDTVTIGETSGVVTRIRMRATTITDWNRRELLVPNKNFITGELINWSLSDPILRIVIPVGIAYGSDTLLAHRTMLRVLREHPMVLDQPEPNVFFMGFGDNSLNFEARIYLSEPTNTGRSRIVHDLHMAIDRACREHGITIAFPQRDLHFVSSEGVLRVAIERGADVAGASSGT